MDSRDFYTTTELAKLLGISRIAVFNKIKNGQIQAQKMGRNFVIFKSDLEDIITLSSSLFKLAKEWLLINNTKIADRFYCQNSGTFQARLVSLETLMIQGNKKQSLIPLIVSITGEIGNNSFDHNIGQWPNTPGVFFGYNLNKRQIILADRGLGVLSTLKRVRPQLKNHQEALKVAFTEIVSGRQPEARGNGLKYVKKVILENKINLIFQTGDAKLILNGKSLNLNIEKTREIIRGCLALITY